ncbi:MAG: glycoside hydrolase family 3 C-terminal domain-containing protein [Firmicutes bacterium]|uniref:Glycoside hydrolase family 3 C-terminal domain-containing protein n=1 Tax=Candidatus Scybalomonas excrementavium TaxID=2840943 RepID=A0A9D9HZB9_9FIRM|nr:glycoside hydrolase family 3 C-terminal domain-containing protein [Candidatus Scybalomonas excrementavium]
MRQQREEMIESLIGQLTLEEKIDMIHGDGLFRTKGVERLGIPPLTFSDGPMGVRNEFENDQWNPIGNTDDYVTYLPSNGALAATWNPTLSYETGKVLGREARGRGKDVILAPGINIKRSPLCGRNFEYISEDPHLIGEMAVPFIQGIQEEDTAACVKHFALNNQETERLWVDVKVSERALREIYLKAFKRCVEEGDSYSLMGAYNRYLGEHCCESKELLNHILREEWQYDGMIVSDWGAVHHTKEAAESALDIEMSVTNNFDEYCMANPLKEAIERGELSEELVDEKVRNILHLMGRLHMIDGKERKAGTYNTLEHHQKALEVARESVVLLKNQEGQLPLSRQDVKKVLVIGDNANRVHSNGGGSAEIKALYEVSPLLGIKKILGGNAEVTYVQGYFADDIDQEEQEQNWQADSLENGGGSTRTIADPTKALVEKRERLRVEAVEKAKEFDTIIFVGGQNHAQDSEGHERPDMKLPYDQDKLIEELLEVNENMIVVIVSGSPVEMPWIHRVKTLVWSWYAGMEGGTATAEVLFGLVNPSGRLPESFPITHMDCSAHCIGEFPGGKTVSYKEGIFVGYRYYDTEQIPILFPFGYGLSYTEFSYDKVEIKQEGEEIGVFVTVTNYGKIAGKETVQCYVGKNDSKVERPRKELKAFAKIELQGGETKTIRLSIKKEELAYYDEIEKSFLVEAGQYQLYVGKSVADICLEESFMIQ